MKHSVSAGTMVLIWVAGIREQTLSIHISGYNNSYTMQGLIYTSDGTEYTELVQEKLGLPSYDGETMTRLDSAKFEEYKAQAIEELTAEGVTFPIHARYFVASGNQTALDSANVIKAGFL